MGRITIQLLRKRAEHNDGILSTLQEITLHQQNIEKIEVVGQVCRNLRILYLQSNVIGRIEGLHHLKVLEYLNLAVNNLTVVENLHRCESLRKLDLTMNFISLKSLPSLANLASLYNLRELHLLGNPCTQWQHYRQYVMAVLLQLQKLDGEDIKQDERNQACQLLPSLQEAIEAELQRGNNLDQASQSYLSADPDNLPGTELQADGDVRRPWCPATRLIEHREQEWLNREAEEARTASQSQLLNGPVSKHQYRHDFPPLPQEGATVMQTNEGKWEFELQDSDNDSSIVLDVCLGKGILTSDIRVEVNSMVVRLLTKGKLLQLELPEEVSPGKSSAQRSKTTGNMLITMPKTAPLCSRRLAALRISDFHTSGSEQQNLHVSSKVGAVDPALSTTIQATRLDSDELPPLMGVS